MKKRGTEMRATLSYALIAHQWGGSDVAKTNGCNMDADDKKDGDETHKIQGTISVAVRAGGENQKALSSG
jgi:hypothetical protein